MKKVSFNIHKWGARAMVSLGALIGISSCSHKTSPNPAEGVYGPPPGYDSPRINVVEDVYGPPVERLDSAKATNEPEPILLEMEQDNNVE